VDWNLQLKSISVADSITSQNYRSWNMGYTSSGGQTPYAIRDDLSSIQECVGSICAIDDLQLAPPVGTTGVQSYSFNGIGPGFTKLAVTLTTMVMRI